MRARKKAVVVHVRFASAPSSLGTLEGEVRYLSGAALVSGHHGDQWPVERASFNATYEPMSDTIPGHDGNYRKRSIEVLAWQLTAPATVAVGYASDPLRGQPGDWLVRYGPDEFGIVVKPIFEATYELLGHGPSVIAFPGDANQGG